MSCSAENQKLLVPLEDGMSVEAVLYGSGTLCVSSQAGCAVGCPFCASGSRGLRRNLSAEELWRQVEAVRDTGGAPRRITVSGIGEPLHNAAQVFAFMRLCEGHRLPVSLTTTGGPVARFEELMGLHHNGVMLSVHAGAGETHRRLVPKGPRFEELMTCLWNTLPSLSRRKKRKIGLNYLILEGLNDSLQEVNGLLPLFESFPELTLHLLTCNPVPGSVYRSPCASAIDALHGALLDKGVNVRRPNRWRTRLEGGCGTLYVRSR